MRALLEPLLDFLFPWRCIACHGTTLPGEYLCGACLSTCIELPLTLEQSNESLASLTWSVAASGMIAAYHYEPESPVYSCIHAMKYRGLHNIGLWLGRLLGERMAGTPFIAGEPLLVPVPLNALRFAERGYNQAEYICKGIAAETGLDICAGLLKRIRYTTSQAGGKLDKEERRKNISDAFVIHRGYVPMFSHRPVLLVDDVVTTGATMSECTLLLLEEGFRDVRLACIARPVRIDRPEKAYQKQDADRTDPRLEASSL